LLLCAAFNGEDREDLAITAPRIKNREKTRCRLISLKKRGKNRRKCGRTLQKSAQGVQGVHQKVAAEKGAAACWCGKIAGNPALVRARRENSCENMQLKVRRGIGACLALRRFRRRKKEAL
jgi:hypothetical protein